MKKIFIILVYILLPLTAVAQRIGYVDTEFVLQQIPEYVSAQEQIERQSLLWKKDIDQRYQELQKVRSNFEAQKLLMQESSRKKVIADIEEKQQALEQLQYIKFGPKGELFQLKVKLIEPIQQKVVRAVQQVADSGNFDMVLNKDDGLIFLYVNSQYDLSEQVIKRMGYKVPEEEE